jgi:hypothetical protein
VTPITSLLPARLRARRLPAAALAAAALALLATDPAAAATPASAAQRGTVLAAYAGAQEVAVVTNRVVAEYHYSGAMGAMRFGSRITYRVSAGELDVLSRAHGALRRVVFLAAVTAARGRSVTIRLGDDSVQHVRLARGKSFRAGETVLVTESRSGAETLRRAPAGTTAGSGGAGGSDGSSGSGGSGGSGGSSGSGGSGSGSGGSGSGTGGSAGVATLASDPTVSGTVLQVGLGSVELQLANGSTFTASMPADTLSYIGSTGDITPCENLTIRYHATAAGAQLDSLLPTGISVSPAVVFPAGDNCLSDSLGPLDVDGTLTAATASSLTISLPGGGVLTFPMSPDSGITDGFQLGTIVDITYDPSDGNLASDVEYVELYTTGTVTAVGNKLTITDGLSGQPETFTPEDASYGQIAVGDVVGVTYWNDGGEPQGDHVSDLTSGAVN